MSNYASIKNQARSSQRAKYNAGGHCAYANGGRTKKPSVVINVISSPGSGAQGPAGSGPMPVPPGMNGPAMPPPPPPKPIAPPTANQAMGAMGGPPGMFAKGGRVKGGLPKGTLPGPLAKKAGAGSGVGRLERNRNPAKPA
jgi:hypothetical protein